MGFVLVFGLIFWLTVAFLGSRKMFMEGTGPLCEPIRSVKKKGPLLLSGVATAGFATAGICVFREVVAIQNREGLIGPLFFMSVVFGVAGAVALSAQLFLEEKSGGVDKA